MESRGRLEYDKDNKVTPDVILQAEDLDNIKSSVQQYEESVRKQWLEAFQHLGVNFDSNHKSVLSDSGVPWLQLTVGDLTRGLREIPRVTNSYNNVTLTSQTLANNAKKYQVVGVDPTKDMTFTLSKGWLEYTTIVDVTDTYRRAYQDGCAHYGTPDGSIRELYHKHSTTSRDETRLKSEPAVPIDSDYKNSSGGCYTIKVQHTHNGKAGVGGQHGCYTKYVDHQHRIVGNAIRNASQVSTTQGGPNTCYTQKLYHCHSTYSSSAQSTSPNAGPTGKQEHGGPGTCFGIVGSCGRPLSSNTVHVCSLGGNASVSSCDDCYIEHDCSVHGSITSCSLSNCSHVDESHCNYVEYNLSCTKSQSVFEAWNKTCRKNPGPQIYSYYQNKLPSLQLGDEYKGTDCPYTEGQTIYYACTPAYDLVHRQGDHKQDGYIVEKLVGSGCNLTAGTHVRTEISYVGSH